MLQRDFFAFCTSLKPIELRAIGSLSQVRHFRDDELIYQSGERSGELFIINRGAVEMMAEGSLPGSAVVLSRGDAFGAVGALLDLPRDHSARARAGVSVQAFRRCDFPELLRRVPSFFLYLSEKLAMRLYQAKELALTPNNSLELTGSLGNFDIVTIYQTILQSLQTGLLAIRDDEGRTISEFFFDKGTPRWGRFEHLTGEEAFWQLFLNPQRTGTFSFSNDARAREGSTMNRNADEILLTAIQMRDQFDELRKRIPDLSAILKREQINLSWNNRRLEDLREVAETVWQIAYSQPLTLEQLHERCDFCDLKIYQVVEELVRTGHFSLRAERDEPMFVQD